MYDLNGELQFATNIGEFKEPNRVTALRTDGNVLVKDDKTLKVNPRPMPWAVTSSKRACSSKALSDSPWFIVNMSGGGGSGPSTMRSKLNKFELVLGRGEGWGRQGAVQKGCQGQGYLHRDSLSKQSDRQTDRQTRLKTLPSNNFVGKM